MAKTQALEKSPAARSQQTHLQEVGFRSHANIQTQALTQDVSIPTSDNCHAKHLRTGIFLTLFSTFLCLNSIPSWPSTFTLDISLHSKGLHQISHQSSSHRLQLKHQWFTCTSFSSRQHLCLLDMNLFYLLNCVNLSRL